MGTMNHTVEGILYSTGNPVRILIKDGIISEVKESSLTSERTNELIVAPGLIDNQVNGYAGVDFSGENLSVETFLRAVRSVWKDGVTSLLPTLITNSHTNLIKNLKIISKACRSDDSVNKAIPGLHLEGPYISSEEGFRGCHPVQHIRNPSWNEFMEYQEASDGKILQVTIAPELDDSMKFIRLCKKNGVVAAIGHTNASAEKILEAVENGAELSTHLGNGCANFIHRHNNPLWPQLANEKLVISVIADGHHLTNEELIVFYKVKGLENIILTSDVMYLAGMRPGIYTFMGSEVLLTEDGRLLNTQQNCLAGASFPLIKGVGNMINITRCSLYEAVTMASENVARVYHMNDRGTIDAGKRADLILFEKDENQINLKETFISGKSVFRDD
jgi:N-acetylglucosamine-6-phosphate deacetylase